MSKHESPGWIQAVVLFICVSLIACLLLPRIARSRRQARMDQSINNLRQIGLATHNYHSAFKKLPQGTGGTTGGDAIDQSNYGRLGPLVALTPFMEAQALWEKISNPYRNPRSGKTFPPMGPVPWFSPEEYTPWGEAPSLLSNAALIDDEEPEVIKGFADPRGSGLTTAYVACYGDGTYLLAEQDDEGRDAEARRNATNRGMFAAATSIRFRDVLDGLSNTIMFSETVPSRVRDPGRSEIFRDVRGLSRQPSLCLGAAADPTAPTWPFGRGAIWADGYLPIGGFQTVLPPNSPSCTSDLGLDDPIVSASSFNGDGVLVLLGDGAVTFISNKIDAGDSDSPGVSIGDGYLRPGSPSPYGIWGALGTRASKEILPNDVGEPVQIQRAARGAVRGPSPFTKWRSSDGAKSLTAEFVRMMDNESVELRSASGNLHHIELNQLSDGDIYRAVRESLLMEKFKEE
ncbi:MAG: DUF1559 domain-containing protein [Planctomycetota bacterium]